MGYGAGTNARPHDRSLQRASSMINRFVSLPFGNLLLMLERHPSNFVVGMLGQAFALQKEFCLDLSHFSTQLRALTLVPSRSLWPSAAAWSNCAYTSYANACTTLQPEVSLYFYHFDRQPRASPPSRKAISKISRFFCSAATCRHAPPPASSHPPSLPPWPRARLVPGKYLGNLEAQ